MAKIKTVNQLVSVFRDAANRHYQINGFGLGDNWEVGASEAKMHPVLWINPVSATMAESENNIGYKTFEIDFEIRIFDLVNKDESNENEVLSDGIDILKDIITEFKGHPYYTNSQLNIVNDIDFEPFTEEFDEEVTGWVCELSFKTPLINSWCGLPMAEIDGFSFPGADCDGYNAVCDATYVEDVIGVYPIEVTQVSGNTKVISIDTSSLTGDTYVTGGTFNNTTNNLELTRNDGVTVLTDLTALKDDTNTFTTGATLNGNIVTFDTNASLSAYTLDLSSLEDVKLTGVTWDNNSTLTHTLSDGTTIDTIINTFSGLTINGSLSATTISGTTFYGDGSNLTGIDSTNIYTDDGTIGSGRIATLTDTLTFDNAQVVIQGDLQNNNYPLTLKNSLGDTKFRVKNDGTVDMNGTVVNITDSTLSSTLYLQKTTFTLDFGYNSTIIHSISNKNNALTYFYQNGWSTNKGFILGNSTKLACEDISLQGDTLINGELVVHAPTTPVLDACHINDSYSFYIDGGELKGRYKNNLGVVTDLTIGGYATDVIGIADTNGVYTFYSDYASAIAAASAGDTIEQFGDIVETGAVSLTIDKNLTIQMNGYSYTLDYTGTTDCVYLSSTSLTDVKILNGTINRINGTGGRCLYSINNVTTKPKLTLDGTTLYTDRNAPGSLMWITSDFTVTGGLYTGAGNILMDTDSTLTNFTYNGSGYVGAWRSRVMISNGYIYTTNSNYGLFINNGGEASNVTVKVNGTGDAIATTGKISNCEGYSSGGSGIRQYGTNDLDGAFNCYGYSDTSYGITVSGGRAQNCVARSVGSYGMIVDLRNNPEVVNCTAWSSAAAGMWVLSSGSTGRIVNCFAQSTLNTTSGHAFLMANGTCRFINCTGKVANAGAYGISSTSSASAYITNFTGEGMTTLFNGVTNLQVTTQDAYGNKLIG